MTPIDTARLLEVVVAVDHREVTELTVLAWHDVIGHLDFEVALAALREARSNRTIDWVEPKHILAHADAVLRRQARQERIQQAVDNPTPPEQRFAPKPENFDDMARAYASGDQAAIDRELAAYQAQLDRAGYRPPDPYR